MWWCTSKHIDLIDSDRMCVCTQVKIVWMKILMLQFIGNSFALPSYILLVIRSFCLPLYFQVTPGLFLMVSISRSLSLSLYTHIHIICICDSDIPNELLAWIFMFRDGKTGIGVMFNSRSWGFSYPIKSITY